MQFLGPDFQAFSISLPHTSHHLITGFFARHATSSALSLGIMPRLFDMVFHWLSTATPTNSLHLLHPIFHSNHSSIIAPVHLHTQPSHCTCFHLILRLLKRSQLLTEHQFPSATFDIFPHPYITHSVQSRVSQIPSRYDSCLRRSVVIQHILTVRLYAESPSFCPILFTQLLLSYYLFSLLVEYSR